MFLAVALLGVFLVGLLFFVCRGVVASLGGVYFWAALFWLSWCHHLFWCVLVWVAFFFVSEEGRREAK